MRALAADYGIAALVQSVQFALQCGNADVVAALVETLRARVPEELRPELHALVELARRDPTVAMAAWTALQPRLRQLSVSA